MRKPEKIIAAPDPELVEAGRCGRWRRDGDRTRAGQPTRKQAALARIEAARGEGLSEGELVKLAEKIVLEARKDDARCRGKVREKGRACGRRHGGLSPSGADSPHFKHGKHSAALALNKAHLDAYNAWLNDPERFSYARQGAGLDALLVNQYARLRAPSIADWKDNSDAHKAFRAAKDAEGQLAAIKAWGDSLAGFDAEKDNAAAVKSAREILTEQRRVSEAEDRRIAREQENLSMQQHDAMKMREIEVFLRRVEIETAPLSDEIATVVRRIMLAAVQDWRDEANEWRRQPRAEVVN